MRVISGKAKGLKLKTIEGNLTRPTKDMVKEALFSMLTPYIYDSTFLDLFSGSGAIGIEALSRGAEKAYFNDINKECVKVINENLIKAKLDSQAVVLNKDYKKFLDSIKDIKFDIIFVDPPYSIGMGVDSIKIISTYNLLKTNGVLVYETDETEDVPDAIGEFEKFNYKRYGRNVLNFYRRKG